MWRVACGGRWCTSCILSLREAWGRDHERHGGVVWVLAFRVEDRERK